MKMQTTKILLIAFPIVIGIVGTFLISLLYIQLRKGSKGDNLKKHRSTEAGLSDLLNYAAVVDDGVIVGKNGSFMAAWLYRGNDDASSTKEYREVVASRANQALLGLGSGWMIHIDAVRKPTRSYSDPAKSHFPDEISQAIDIERRNLFESLGTMYEGYFVLTATWFPPTLVQRQFVELMFEDEQKKSGKKGATQNLIKQFKRDIQTLEEKLSIAFSLTRLVSRQKVLEDGKKVLFDDFLSWIQFCISGEQQPIMLPANPAYLDSYLGGRELWGGITPKIGDKYIQIVSIEGFPMESYPGILSGLAELPVEYRWSTRFIFLDQHEALAVLEKFRKKWKQKVRGFLDQVFNTASGNIDQDARDMELDAVVAKAEISSGVVASGYLTSVIVLMNEDIDKIEQASRRIRKYINSLGFVSRIETINTMDAFFGSLPGHGVENVRRPLVNTMNLADLLPSSTIWTGLNHAPNPMYPPNSPPLMHVVTSGSTPFRLNIHVGDLGHTFIIGPTGAGKSTLLATLAAQLRRYEKMSIYSFDKGMSMYPLTKAIGGAHFEIAGDGNTLAFCPLQYLETKGDRAWATEWVDTMLALNGVITTPGQRNEIAATLEGMNDSGAKTLSEFTLTVQDESIREALKIYTVDGAMGFLLDADKDGLNLFNFTTFEIEDLMNLGEKFALPVLLYIFRRIEKSLHGQPAVIFLDEAWVMLGHEAFRDKIREWFKVMRKANCAIVMATQNLTDAVNSGIFDVIVESSATKIMLPNIYAREEDTAALYGRMGLNPRQLEVISSAIPKRQYYYISESGRRLFDLALGPLTLAFVGASDKESIAQIKQFVERWGTEWPKHWLASKNIRLDDYRRSL
jgi:type IV secretion system protein VirB4